MGLNNMVRYDVVKENDGFRMIIYLKFDMFEFYEKNYLKYFIFGYRLFVNLIGVVLEQLKYYFIWECIVNENGGKVKNIFKRFIL